MLRTLKELNKARQLAETGQHAAVVTVLATRPRDELEDSPTMALFYGTAHARLGRTDVAERWVELALSRSRERADRAIETRALNVRGVIALFGGRIDEASKYLTEALALAKREGDHAAIARCCNNLGIISSLRGEYAHAIGSYTMAIAAFQQVGLKGGRAEAQHNLGITYRDSGDLDKALEEADRAVVEARDSGDRSLVGQTLAGRAEIRLLLGDVRAALREIELALEIHRELSDDVQEAQDLRILGNVLAANSDHDGAEHTLRDVIKRAESLDRPLLAAMASRDLAHLLRGIRLETEAMELARQARARFTRLGAQAELRKLDEVFYADRT
ncbi:MAG: tetratricopeptide repeat protein [Gammaproteobacteria bacterium]